MAKINLKNMDMGLGSTPKIDPLHDTQTLLNRSLGPDSDDYRALPLGMISVNPENDYAKEDTEEDIKELALDIERNGLLHNIVVSDKTKDGEGYLILSGERRYRAYRWLYDNRRDNRYAMIHCKVLSGLDALDEMLVLDAANLQTRGSMSDEVRFRKATVRFIDNLRKKGGVSEEDAKTLAARYTGVSEKLFDKNIMVEERLHPDILALLDRDLIPKNQAVQYARLPESVQEILAQNLNAAYESGSAALRDANERLATATKTVAELTAKLEAQEKSMREIDDEITEAQLSLNALNAMAEAGEDSEEILSQIELVKRSLGELEVQKRMYTSTILSARAALKKSEERLSAIAPERKTGSDVQDNVAHLVNKTMKKAESGIAAITSRTAIGRMRKLDPSGRAVMLERLCTMQKALDEAIAVVKKQGEGK